MHLDTAYMARLAAVERDVRSGLGLYGYVGSNTLTDADFAAALRQRGITYTEREVPGIGTWAAPVRELHYTHPTDGARWAYLVDHRPDVDSWGEDVFVFVRPVPDERLYETLRLVERQERDLGDLVRERKRAIEADYPPYWGQINHYPQHAIWAWHLRTQGWTPQIAAILATWGAYSGHRREAEGLDNPFVQSLLRYAELIAALPDPAGYLHGLLDQVLPDLSPADRRAYQALI